MYGGTDYYNVLGVDHYATRIEIKQAYRRLAKKHHPDVNPNDPTAEEQFQKINEAYETLYDSSQRVRYDSGFEDTFRTAYASSAYGYSESNSAKYSGKYSQDYTQDYTQSGYGYTDFGTTNEGVSFEDLSFLQKAERYSNFAFQNLPNFHFIVLAALGVFLLIIPLDNSMSFSQYTGISMRLTFFITQVVFSSIWVERSCHNLKNDFMLLPMMVMFTHGASGIFSVIVALAVQLFIGLPKYLFNL